MLVNSCPPTMWLESVWPPWQAFCKRRPLTWHYSHKLLVLPDIWEVPEDSTVSLSPGFTSVRRETISASRLRVAEVRIVSTNSAGHWQSAAECRLQSPPPSPPLPPSSHFIHPLLLHISSCLCFLHPLYHLKFSCFPPVEGTIQCRGTPEVTATRKCIETAGRGGGEESKKSNGKRLNRGKEDCQTQRMKKRKTARKMES